MIRLHRRTWFAVFGILVTLVLIGWPQRVEAHARLIESIPAASDRLTSAPANVVLRFDERVVMTASGIRVFDASANRVDSGEVRVNDSNASIGLTPLREGAFVVVWRAVSTDGHPISGSFTFQIGEGDQAALASVGEREVLAASAPTSVRIASRIVRGLLFAPLMLLVGVSLWCIFSLPMPPYRWFLPVGWAAAASAALLLFVDGAYVEGRALSGAFRIGTALDALERVTGRSIAGLGVLGLLFGFSLQRAADDLERIATNKLRGSIRIELMGLVPLTSVLMATTGHATAGRLVLFAVAANAFHIAAVSTWLAGLFLLGISLSRRGRDAPSFDREAALRWSSLATKAIIVMIATGTFATWRQVGSRSALRTTDFGRLLSIKLVIVAVMLAFGALHRRALLASSSTQHPWRRPTVVLETLGGVAALAITTALSATIPARAEVAQPVAFRVTTASTRTDFTVSPAKAGNNLVHIYVFGRDGTPRDISDVQLTFTHNQTGTLVEIDPVSAGRGHEEARGVALPFRGSWTLTARVYLTDFDLETATQTFTVR